MNKNKRKGYNKMRKLKNKNLNKKIKRNRKFRVNS